MAKKLKIKGFGARLSKAVVSTGIGVGVQVAEELIGRTEGVDYGMIAVGAALPVFVKGSIAESVGDTLVGIGAYKMAERLRLAEKIGLKDAEEETPPATKGLGDRHTIGNSHLFDTMASKKKAEQKADTTAKTVQAMG